MRTQILFSALIFPFIALGGDDSTNQARLFDNVTPRRVSTTLSRSDIRVNVNMALVPVTVMDSLGRNVTGLLRENFSVYDGGEPVSIVSFGLQDQPITVGLVFDCSGSMAQKYKTARLAPLALFSRLSNQDSSFLVEVADRAEVRQGLTSDFSNIEDALLFTHPKGTTSLLDGVYLALTELKKASTPRKALVIVSDGGENNSRYTLRELEKIAVEADTQIFAIGLYDDPRTEEEVMGPELLRHLTQVTGGVSFVIHNVDGLESAMGRIGATLHNQYVLGYYPPDSVLTGKYRKIRVQLRLPAGLPPLRVAARSGYYVPDR